MQLDELSGEYAVARAGPATPVPDGLLSGAGFRSVSRTDEELSVVAPIEAVADAGMESIDGGWTAFKLQGPFAFDEVGVIASLSAPLAEAELGIFVVSTFDTDYILVKSENAAAAANVWRAHGQQVTML